MTSSSEAALAALLSAALRAALQEARAGVHEATAAAIRTRAREGEAWSVLALGKVSLPMLRGAEEGLRLAGAARGEALLVAPDGVALPRSTKHALYMHAAHPLPDVRSVRAADRALSLARRASEGEGRLLVLVSGGASSLVAKPVPGLGLARKRAVIAALLRAGLTIADVNLVRRHLSLVKGGGLLRAAGRARVVTLLVSDVLGGAPFDIGSGPSCPDPTTRAAATRVLRRLGPLSEGVSAVETLKPRARAPVDVELVASPAWFASRLADALAAAGLRPRTLAPSDDDVRALADEYVQLAYKLRPGEARVRAAEPRVSVAEGGGRGGRATHLAALLAERLPPGVAFVAGATDGVDGSSGTMGAAVHHRSFAGLARGAVSEALARFDTGPLHRRAGTALFCRAPTGVNFADVHVLAAAPVTSS